MTGKRIANHDGGYWFDNLLRVLMFIAVIVVALVVCSEVNRIKGNKNKESSEYYFDINKDKILDKFTSNAEYKVVSKKTYIDSGIYHTVYIDMEFVNINDENDVVKVEISSNHNSIFGEFNDLVVGTTFKVNWK